MKDFSLSTARTTSECDSPRVKVHSLQIRARKSQNRQAGVQDCLHRPRGHFLATGGDNLLQLRRRPPRKPLAPPVDDLHASLAFAPSTDDAGGFYVCCATSARRSPAAHTHTVRRRRCVFKDTVCKTSLLDATRGPCNMDLARPTGGLGVALRPR